MGNRHHHKKLRAQVRARMSKTGETYQQALAHILAQHTPSAHGSVELVAVDYFGVAATLATYELAGRLACLVVSGGPRSGPFPVSPLVALGMRGPRIVH